MTEGSTSAESKHPLRERAGQAPELPGVYQFLDARGRVLYVGKARNLRRRVISYFSRHDSPKTTRMLAHARRLEFVVTATEVEALILENRLIKAHRPRYNVVFRDDKTYPYICVTVGETWPRAFITRRVRQDGHQYFGPFLGKGLAGRLMELLRLRTQVRTCAIQVDGSLERPCLYHGMGACLAPCVAGLTTRESYSRAVEEVVMLLQGRHRELRPRLLEQMWAASEVGEYERAARYRDLMQALEELARGQHVELAGTGSVDVIGMAGDGRDATVVVLPYRDGRLVDKREFHWEGLGEPADQALLAAFLPQFYEANPAVPARIEVPAAPGDEPLITAFLRGKRGGPVRVTVPRRGERVKVMALAQENARQAFRLRFRQPRREAERVAALVGATLGLEGTVRRIECFDVSHTVGEDQVASLVVWEAGAMRRSEYRSFNVRSEQGSDDAEAIAEAVSRRYRRRLADGGVLPDLVVVDGGAVQQRAAERELTAMAMRVPVVGLAKKLEELHLPGRANALSLPSHHEVRLLLQSIRDEAHRSAITRHRRRRRRRRLATELLALPGVGPKRARALLRLFGSVDGVRAADREELTAALGKMLGERVWKFMHKPSDKTGGSAGFE